MSALAAPLASGMGRIRGARSQIRRQLREQQRVRAVAMAMVITMLLGAPLLYLGIQTATRDPVLNSLAGLSVPQWAAQSPEDRIIGSRWCFIECRFRERRMISEGEPGHTNGVYEQALERAGWSRWDVEGCPQVEVDGYYSCWTRDEYTLDLWVHLPACAYDPRNLRPEVAPGQTGAPADPAAEDCSGSVVEIKMQNRVADERGRPAPADAPPDAPPPGTPAAGTPSAPSGSPDAGSSPAP